MPKITVYLNGTNENPYHKFGLTQNPFPQIAEHGKQAAEMALARLGGDPIPHDRYAEYIREILAGLVSEELIKGLINQFKPGVLVKNVISYQD